MTVVVDVEGSMPAQIHAELNRSAPEHTEAYEGIGEFVRLTKVIVVSVGLVTNLEISLSNHFRNSHWGRCHK